ncbi:hypothetical protein UXP41_04270 [Enterobacter hormaechei]|uniref:hypothetical protein n=1 Tax=Enterobacterales TaxID=91347 RepID=UPI001F2A75DB|nr:MULTISPECIES: hypothetical protein [Enterobacteriaceae]MDD9628210.1 hypothetical protein [Klebsiella michiganensis]MDD9634085.1 hypothetical protein [Klebsiella michiganensis]MDD9644964.1 hypothetical protein [Klebsiella michiganensis]MDD9656397.1 hypothetical protein [Klebsiella michiganensis]
MELKKLNTSLLLLVNILVFIAILCLIKILFNGVKKFEWGNVADWVNAICNIIIALSVIYAGLQARNWFKQNKKLNSLSSSHKLAMKYESLLWEINSRLYNDTLIIASIHDDINRKEKSREEITVLILNEINRNVTTDLTELANLYTTKSMLKRFDIHPSPELEKLIEDILKLRTNYLNSYYNYLATINKYKDCIEHEDVINAHQNLKENKRSLAKIFQFDMCKNSINQDYNFH